MKNVHCKVQTDYFSSKEFDERLLQLKKDVQATMMLQGDPGPRSEVELQDIYNRIFSLNVYILILKNLNKLDYALTMEMKLIL